MKIEVIVSRQEYYMRDVSHPERKLGDICLVAVKRLERTSYNTWKLVESDENSLLSYLNLPEGYLPTTKIDYIFYDTLEVNNS